MQKFFRFVVLAILCLTLLPLDSALGITRVGRVLNVLEFFGGSSLPAGTREGLPDFDFTINNLAVDVDSDDIYDNSFHLGLSYGQLRNNHFLISIGFRYTKHEVLSVIPLSVNTVLLISGDPSFNQYDIDLDINYLATDIMSTIFAPYAGLGFQAGLTSISEQGFDTESEANIGLSLNFGGDLKLWSSVDGRSFVTLASVNNYNFYGSSNRPKYLNVGIGLKYYFRP